MIVKRIARGDNNNHNNNNTNLLSLLSANKFKNFFLNYLIKHMVSASSFTAEI